MKIYDCFTFFNELDLLELRLNYLNEIVDYFVLVEANITHSGKSKPYYYEENKERFKDFNSKIIHIKVQPNIEGWRFEKSEEYDENDDYWKVENLQRNSILEGLINSKEGDIIIISDLDEIPSVEAIKTYKTLYYGQIISNKQFMFNYYLNYKLDAPNDLWGGSVFSLRKHNITPQEIRKHKNDEPSILGGWHFSFLGGIDNIIKKITSFAHSEYSEGKYIDPNYIEEKINKGRDLFFETTRSFINIEDNKDKYPPYLVNNLPKYSKYIKMINEEKFSIIIPTLWKANEQLLPMLDIYINNELIGEIIIIDNDISNTPTLPQHPKIKILPQKENIFVNPAWNLGVKTSEFNKLMIANDDILLQKSDFNELLNKILYSLLTSGKLIGIDQSCYHNINEEKIKLKKINFPDLYKHEIPYGFGCLMFINKEDYKEIPEELKIGCGDNFLFQNLEPWVVENLNMEGKVSSTIESSKFFNQIIDMDNKIYKNKILKPILCFYIGYDNEVDDGVKNLAKNLTEFYDVFIFGSFNSPPYKEENIRYLNISKFYHFKTYNDINTVIIYKYLNYLLEFDVKFMSKRTHIWLPQGIYNPYWDFKLLPNEGLNLIKNSIDKIDGLITTNHDDLWDLKTSLPHTKVFFIDNQNFVDWVNYLLEGVNLMRFMVSDRNYEKGLRVLASYLPKNTVMAEIGSYTGESTSIFLDSGNIKTLYAIDPWTQWSWEQEYDATCYTNFEQVENLFDKRVKGDPRLVKLKMTINEAKEYMPPQLDFIYIDGNHDYEPVKNDIIESLKLIKPGGIIAGHDYNALGVRQAVDELLGRVDFHFIDDSWFKYL